MPLGWYLAQGLIPLTPSSSDDEEGPCELPNGRLVCGPHGLVTCGKCCVDYSFMDDVLSHASEDEDEDGDHPGSEVEATDLDLAADGSNTTGPNTHRSNNQPIFVETPQIPADPLDALGPRLRRGTGRAFPTKFVPSSASVTPSELFSGQKSHMLITRYTFRNDAGKVLIRTDGACVDNGQPNPKAGWAFWHGSGPSGELLVASGRLETKGPFGDDSIQTSNRAELRAVIAALRFRYWPGEGFHTLVVATDSKYAVEGSTNWAKKWVENGWTTRGGAGVKNRDLWEVLLGEIERYKDEGMTVEFWRIPREWNTVADAAAKEAAAEVDAPNGWRDVMGINC
ncbi:ribonuclease H [Madurella fahalii]|uniref:ribonuclease H n=1 Tax=Madurella fahalii TaxID=1157608 RepID=A0ABQ0GAC2_9PEZI